MRELLEHQKRALDYALTKKNPALFMEMRLGKTLVAIRRVQADPSLKRALVVSTLTTLPSWGEELTKEGERFFPAFGAYAKRRGLICEVGSSVTRRVWTLLNYEGLRSDPDIALMDWDAVVLDESTRIKNPRAQITEVCVLGFREAKCRIILTGSPMTESYLDLFTQFQFLDGQFMGYDDFWKFRAAYFMPGPSGYEWHPVPAAREKIKAAAHKGAFFLTRRQVNVGSAKFYEKRTVTLPAKLQKQYRAAEADFEFDGEETQWQIVLDTWLARLAGGFHPDGSFLSDHKYKELASLLLDDLASESVVVWFRFNKELHGAKDFLCAAGIPGETVVTLTGETAVKERQEALSHFQSGRARILLGQIQCARYGLDCSRADTAIYYSNVYSCESRLQSEDRIVHPRKTDPLLIIDLVTQGTIDEEAVQALQGKKLDARLIMQQIKEGIQRRREHATGGV